MSTRVLREKTPWGELVLRIEGDRRPVVRLILEGTFLMDSESVASEIALAREGLAKWAELSGNERRAGGVRSPRVLVGGLGLGITLRAVLEPAQVSRAADSSPSLPWPRVSSVVVVELLEPLLEWNRTYLADLNGHALDDPRVRCICGDLVQLLASREALGGTFDLLLLDIDNGPTWLSREENAALYSPAGLEHIVVRLRPGGVAVFWATEKADEFELALDGAAATVGVKWGRESVAAQPLRGQRVPPDVLYWMRTSG